MPLYEYQCESCEHRFERIQKFSDPPPDACPKCGGAVRKLMSSPAFQFKGTGWYVTDYAKKSPGDAGKTGAGVRKDSGGAKSEEGGGKSEGSGASEGSSGPSAKPESKGTSSDAPAATTPKS